MSASKLPKLTPAQRTSVVTLFRGLITVRSISNFVRIISAAHVSTPLGYAPPGSSSSRFSPRIGGSVKFSLIYGASNLEAAVFETLVRDKFDLSNRKSRILAPADYLTHLAFNFSTSERLTLKLLDLTSGNAARCGVPTDVIRHSHHTSGQFFSEFVYEHMTSIDGLIYPSRFTECPCVAVYDRAIKKKKLVVGRYPIRLDKPLLNTTMGSWDIRVK